MLFRLCVCLLFVCYFIFDSRSELFALGNKSHVLFHFIVFSICFHSFLFHLIHKITTESIKWVFNRQTSVSFPLLSNNLKLLFVCFVHTIAIVFKWYYLFFLPLLIILMNYVIFSSFFCFASQIFPFNCDFNFYSFTFVISFFCLNFLKCLRKKRIKTFARQSIHTEAIKVTVVLWKESFHLNNSLHAAPFQSLCVKRALIET